MAAKDVQRFGPYVILDRIGDGGMAEIFLAKMQGYSGFEKLIALKKILPRYSQNRTFAQMLIHEAKLAAALQHFNVVQVLDLGEIDRQVYIAMEYVRGRDLAAVLSNTYRRKERLPLGLSLCIATEFMTGLDYAHRVRSSEGQALGIIHRDISPQNVLISYEGEVKVTDFGIARVAEKEGFQLPGNLHGKFGYMSPEQVLGQDIDQRSDIFSAGVVLYEMLTGQRLFRGKEHKETIKMIISHVIPPPSAVNPEVPPSVDRICAKALARDRNARYQTMGALLGELARVADSFPRRAATRDLAVYMRRQFGASVGRRTDGSGPTSMPGGFGTKSGDPDPGGLGGANGERIPLGEILMNQGAITMNDLELVLAEQRARGGRIGELLIASGSISEDDLLRALKSQSGLPSISQEDLTTNPPPASLLRRFPREAAEATLMLPISINEEDRSVRLAVSDPYDDRAILETKVVLGVNNVTVFLARRGAIRAAIDRWYVEEPEPETPPEALPVVPEPAQAAGRPVVLFADADPAVLDALVARVREEDCDVVTATDGKAARQLCRERLPKVAFLDAALPGIDGYNILLELRSKSADAAVFITSSRGDELRQSKALELGADDFIVKPFSIEIATAKIRREIQKRSGGRKVIAPAVNMAGVSGSLKDMTALDIMQSLELGKKTAHVVIQYNDGRSGELGVRNGDLKGCVAGELSGEEGFYLLARPADGLFRIEYRDPQTPANITKPNTFLMIEAMRRLDEDRTAGRPAAPAEASGAPSPAQGATALRAASSAAPGSAPDIAALAPVATLPASWHAGQASGVLGAPPVAPREGPTPLILGQPASPPPRSSSPPPEPAARPPEAPSRPPPPIETVPPATRGGSAVLARIIPTRDSSRVAATSGGTHPSFIESSPVEQLLHAAPRARPPSPAPGARPARPIDAAPEEVPGASTLPPWSTIAPQPGSRRDPSPAPAAHPEARGYEPSPSPSPGGSAGWPAGPGPREAPPAAPAPRALGPRRGGTVDMLRQSLEAARARREQEQDPPRSAFGSGPEPPAPPPAVRAAFNLPGGWDDGVAGWDQSARPQPGLRGRAAGLGDDLSLGTPPRSSPLRAPPELPDESLTEPGISPPRRPALRAPLDPRDAASLSPAGPLDPQSFEDD